MLVDEFKGQKVQDVKKTIQKKMIDAVGDRLPWEAIVEGLLTNELNTILSSEFFTGTWGCLKDALKEENRTV